MSVIPLMPKATAVWLVENTSLTFEQIADYCKLHPLEVKAIADGESATTIKGLAPLTAGQLTRDTAFDSPETLVAFALGITLFVITLALNIVALAIVRKYREQYD